MKVLHIFISLTEDTGNFDRLKKMNEIEKQYVISCDKKKLPEFSIKNFYRTTYFQFPKLEFIKNYFYNKATFSCYKKNFEDISLDLVHSYFAYPCASGGKQIADFLKIPHVITVRGSDVLIYPNQNAYLKSKISEVLKSATLIICLSKHLMEACHALGVEKNKMIHLPEGHDAKVFYWDEKVKKEDFILFAGNLIPIKNPIRLINAFALLAKDNDSMRLKIAGSGILKNELALLIQQKNLSNKVEFIGQLPANQLADQMRRAKLLVLPSLSEGWPNVIQESMACGTAVVASKVGGIPEMIIEGQNGFLCDHFSELDISEKIKQALKYNWESINIQKLPNLYTREKIIENVFQLYRRVKG